MWKPLPNNLTDGIELIQGGVSVLKKDNNKPWYHLPVLIKLHGRIINAVIHEGTPRYIWIEFPDKFSRHCSLAILEPHELEELNLNISYIPLHELGIELA